MRKKWWIVALGLVVVAGLGYVGIGVWRRSAAQTAAVQEVLEDTAVVERGTLRVFVSGAGSLTPQAEVSLSFSSGGQVAEVLVEEGQQVNAGDRLIWLHDADARNAVAEAELQVARAEIDLEQARIETGAGLAQAQLEAAQAAYDGAVTLSARVGDQLASDRISLQRAQDALADAQENYNQAWDPARDWELYAIGRKGALEAERESTEQALRTAQLDLEEAQAKYSLAIAGISESDVRNAQETLLNAQVALESEPLKVPQLENALEQARLQFESAQWELAATVLIAPTDGTVTDLGVAVGETVSAGQAAVVLSDLRALQVEINVDETDVARVSVGQETQITLDAFPGAELTGEVTFIAPVAKVESGVVLYPVTVQLSPVQLPVRAGMTADVEITTASRGNALIVPLRAVHTEGARTYVHRLAGDQIERMEVELGLMTDTEVEITGGLEEGDVVSVVAPPSDEPSGGFRGPFGGMR